VLENWMSDFNKASNSCFILSQRIFILANAFAKTGNQAICEELMNISEHLEDTSDLIHKAVGNKLNEDIENLNAGTENMLQAVFTGMELTKKEQANK
jgi:hypothetical protein